MLKIGTQVKISVTRKKLEKKSIYRCKNAGKAQFHDNQSKNTFLVQYSWKQRILGIKRENAIEAVLTKMMLKTA